MWSCSHSVLAPVTPQQVWRVWRDLPNWPTWDRGLDWVTADGGLERGGRYTLKPTGGPAVTAVIRRAQPDIGFTDVTRLPLCELEFDHAIEPTADGVRITHRATFRGLAAPLFRRIIGAGIARDLPATMARLVECARTA